jgi:hypothetical protein
MYEKKMREQNCDGYIKPLLPEVLIYLGQPHTTGAH